MLAVRFINNGFFCLGLLLILFWSNSRILASESPLYNEEMVLSWANQVRVKNGLPELIADPRLNEAAKTHSENMVRFNLLSESSPSLGTPFERARTSGVTDTNNLVVVAKAHDLDHLTAELESGAGISRILSPEMTHLGVGMATDTEGSQWVTLHMTGRTIDFSKFTIHQSNTVPSSRSIAIQGHTQYKKIKALLLPSDEVKQDLTLEHIVIPDSNGNFEVTISFGISTGSFGIEFYILDQGEYKLRNSFSMDIR